MNTTILLLQAAPGINLHKTLAGIMILLIIGLFFALALFSNLLRDQVNDCEQFNKQAIKLHRKNKSRSRKYDNPYSLSKVQFAVWTVIISCSFIYLALCYGNCADVPINQTALILMGIGAGVTTSTALIDSREVQQGILRHQNSPSEGFFLDILSDKDGISLHRFQNVVWTVIAMTIYLTAVYGIQSGCILPELSPTLLILTGISSTTYVVLRANENAELNAINNPADVVEDLDPVSQTNPQLAGNPGLVNPSQQVTIPAPAINEQAVATISAAPSAVNVNATPDVDSVQSVTIPSDTAAPVDV